MEQLVMLILVIMLILFFGWICAQTMMGCGREGCAFSMSVLSMIV